MAMSFATLFFALGAAAMTRNTAAIRANIITIRGWTFMRCSFRVQLMTRNPIALDENTDLFELAKAVADLRRPLEIEVLRRVFHFPGEAGDGFVEVLVSAEVELPAADRAGDVQVVEIGHLHKVAVDGLVDR